MKNSITFRNFRINGTVEVNGCHESVYEHDEHKIHDSESYNRASVNIDVCLDGTLESETDAPLEFYKEVGSFLIKAIKESNTTSTVTEK